jgi:hypothetical protein
MSRLSSSQSWLQAAFHAAPGVCLLAPIHAGFFAFVLRDLRILARRDDSAREPSKSGGTADARELKAESRQLARKRIVGHASACPGERSSPLRLPPGSNRASSASSLSGSAPKGPRASSRIENGRPRAGRQAPLPAPREAVSRASLLDVRMESPLALGIVAKFRQAFERVMPGSNLPEFDVL